MIFVDTSAWLAVSDVRDGNHRPALEFYAKLLKGSSGRLLTSDYVMDETLTLMRKYTGADTVQKFVSGVETSPSDQLIWVTQDHCRGALDLFLNQHHRTWSFTDCTSFTIMREIGIRDAFTFDSAFRQAGFEADPV